MIATLEATQQRIEAAPEEMRARLAREADAAVIAAMRAELAEEYEPLETISAYDILTTEWPEPVWAVPGLLPAGLTIFAGKQKIGKSWLALQIAQAVAAGGVALGEHAEAGPILYLALEDNPRRLQERMSKQGWPADPSIDADFMIFGDFFDRVGDLRNGGGERLARQIERRHYRLVVIDTLSRAVSGTADQMDVGDMTSALGPVQEIAFNNNCAVVMVDHHNKMASAHAPDVINNILGSTAKAAVADSLWGIYKEPGKAGAKLAIVGRDIEEKTLALKWDFMTGCWQVEGDAYELEMTARRQEILDAIGGIGRASVGEISETTEQDRGNCFRRLQDLVNEGLVLRIEDGRRVYYDLPS